MGELRILFLGDLVGRPGLHALLTGLASLRDETQAHAVAVNGENMADGFGIGPDDAVAVFGMGVSVITSGNHIWQQNPILPILESDSRILRPLNYPSTLPGHGSVVVDVCGEPVGFINILGQLRMGMTVDCPFRTVQKAVNELKKSTRCILVDFHAEDVREKEGMFHHLDGSVSAVVGTHTHVPTADECILPGGTAVVTDLGMCGPINSVIGSEPDLSIRRSMTQLPLRMKVHDTPGELMGVLITIASDSGRALSIKRVRHSMIKD